MYEDDEKLLMMGNMAALFGKLKIERSKNFTTNLY